MTESKLSLSTPPIVEAVLDIECDLPPGLQIAELEERALNVFRDSYPKLRTQLLQEHQIAMKPGELPALSIRHGVQALQFLQDDERQLVQVRVQGFSFNRLAPYTSLDDYLPEIKRAWGLYVDLLNPVQVRQIRVRYINRILLPMTERRVDLDHYFTVAPHLPDEDRLELVGFLNQHVAVETATGNQVSTVLTAQPPEDNWLPVIFDNSAVNSEPCEPDNWSRISERIQALRVLKNHVFMRTLTTPCLALFQQP
jgi:uncharacterized protein (TIGR04255 family)